jgi:transcriptional regulator with XRE-family HTH domain
MTNTANDLVKLVRERRDLPPPAMRRAIRESADLSLDQVANALGVSRQAVSHWEQGARDPRPEHLRAYAKLLRELMGVTP